ncbi:MAG: Coq4 family protein [Pseudomonadota bacterium]
MAEQATAPVTTGEAKAPIIDRDFAEKFLRAADRPLDYGVYFLFHDWFEEAPQHAIDAYEQELLALPGAKAFIEAGYLPEPLTLEALRTCDAGTLGAGYYQFVVDNQLEANLGRNYRAFNEQLHASGKLARLPETLSYMMLRGFQIHDMQHVLTGIDSTPFGELKLAAFYLAQLRFPYHAMRMAVTMAHMAFVSPQLMTQAMDVIAEGWSYGRRAKDLNFVRWEDELNTPLVDLRARYQLE